MLSPLPEKEGGRASPLREVTQEFKIVPHTTVQGANLILAPRHGRFVHF